MTKNTNFIDRDQFIQMLAERGSFTVNDAKIFLKTFEDIFAESIENGIDIDIRGLMHLYIQILPARKGVNARESRLQGKTIYQDFPAGKRAVVQLGQNLRDLLRSPEKRKIKSKANDIAISEMENK